MGNSQLRIVLPPVLASVILYKINFCKNWGVFEFFLNIYELILQINLGITQFTKLLNGHY